MQSLKRYTSIYFRSSKKIYPFLVLLLVLSVLSSSFSAASEPVSFEWKKVFQGFQANSVVQTVDGGYLLAGYSLSSQTSLIKTDSFGNLQWQKSFGNIVSVDQNSGSDYVLFCENGDIVKIDTEGNILHSFTLKINTISSSLQVTDNQGNTILVPSRIRDEGIIQGIISEDEKYLVVGNSVNEWREAYAWLKKVDDEGNIMWDKNFTGGFHVSSVVNTIDNGFALAGNWKNNFWLAKFDSNGNQQWSQNYAYGDPLDTHFTYSLTQTKDAGFILAGTGEWQTNSGMIPWLIKINYQGHEQWSLPYSQYSDDSFSSILQTTDEGYFIVKPNSASLMRTDSSGSEVWKIPFDVSPIISRFNSPMSCLISTRDGGHVFSGSTSSSTVLIKLCPEAGSVKPAVTVYCPESKTYDTCDIPLTFSVDNQGYLFTYTLDDQQEKQIAGNTTLTGLTVGAHTLVVSVKDSNGLVVSSDTILFSIEACFPTGIVILAVALAVAAAVAFMVYLKRQKISEYRKRGPKNLFRKQNLSVITKNKLLWTLTIIIISTGLVFVQVFYPYVYYSSSTVSSDESFEVGVSYVYERDSVDQIYSEVARIKELGFKVIRVNLVCDSVDANNHLNTLTDIFFNAAKVIGIKVALIINNHDRPADINYHLNRWGSDLAYIQILNEPDVASSWDMGALFTDDEAGSRFEEIYSTVEQHGLNAQLYTNFSPAFIVRTNLPILFSEKLDFVGFDVFMDSFLTISPNLIQLLQKITGKDVVISEFGMSTSNDETQSEYIIKGLNLFKNMGINGCWLVYWNSVDNSYGIRGRSTEQTIGEWIAQNA